MLLGGQVKLNLKSANKGQNLLVVLLAGVKGYLDLFLP